MMVRNMVPGNFSAVSANCLAIRKKEFLEAGCFDSQTFPEYLFDADLCLKLREKDLRIVMTPFADMARTRRAAGGSVSRSESSAFRERWKRYIESDPFYNPNLSRSDGSFSIDV